MADLNSVWQLRAVAIRFHHDKARCVGLTNERLDQVVDAIVAWYDAVEAVLIM